MSKPKNTITEFRSYHLPVEFPALVLTGEHWLISDRPAPHLHFHNCLEIGFCHSGSGILKVGDRELPFSAGDLTCISQRFPHTTWSSAGTASKWSYLMVDPAEFISASHFAAGLSMKYTELLSALDTAAVIPSKQTESCSFYFRQIVDAISQKTSYYQLRSRADFVSLIIELNRLLAADAQQDALSSGGMKMLPLTIMPALVYIRENYMNAFSINSLCDLCGLSPTHFRRVFSQVMNATPLEYLTSVRIGKACVLLRSTDDSILNISENVGFHSITSFNRHFSRLVGMTPREFRSLDYIDEEKHRVTIMRYNGWLEPESFASPDEQN